MLVVPETVLLDILREDDGVPVDVYVPVTGFDGGPLFGCK